MDELYFSARLIVGCLCLVLGIILVRKYQKQKNRLSLYLIGYFLLMGFGWGLLAFLFSPLVFNIYAVTYDFLLVLSTICLFLLFFFVALVEELSRKVIISWSVVFLILFGLYFINPLWFTFQIFAVLISIYTIYLFLKNYWKKNDGKSLGFALGLLCLFIAQMLGAFPSDMTQNIAAIVILVMGLVYGLGFAGIFNKSK